MVMFIRVSNAKLDHDPGIKGLLLRLLKIIPGLENNTVIAGLQRVTG